MFQRFCTFSTFLEVFGCFLTFWNMFESFFDFFGRYRRNVLFWGDITWGWTRWGWTVLKKKKKDTNKDWHEHCQCHWICFSQSFYSGRGLGPGRPQAPLLEQKEWEKQSQWQWQCSCQFWLVLFGIFFQNSLAPSSLAPSRFSQIMKFQMDVIRPDKQMAAVEAARRDSIERTDSALRDNIAIFDGQNGTEKGIRS